MQNGSNGKFNARKINILYLQIISRCNGYRMAIINMEEFFDTSAYEFI